MAVFPQIPGANPVLQTDPTQPLTTSPASTGVLDLVITLIGKTLGNPNVMTPTGIFILIGLRLFTIFAAKTPNKLDDKAAALFLSLIEGQSNPIKIDPK